MTIRKSREWISVFLFFSMPKYSDASVQILCVFGCPPVLLSPGKHGSNLDARSVSPRPEDPLGTSGAA